MGSYTDLRTINRRGKYIRASILQTSRHLTKIPLHLHPLHHRKVETAVEVKEVEAAVEVKEVEGGGGSEGGGGGGGSQGGGGGGR